MYRLLIDQDRGSVQYGVGVGLTFVHQITADRTEAEALLTRMERAALSETHVWDVVEDWFGLSDEEKRESRSGENDPEGSLLL